MNFPNKILSLCYHIVPFAPLFKKYFWSSLHIVYLYFICFLTYMLFIKIVHEGHIYVNQKNLANGVISYECKLRKNGKHNSAQAVQGKN